MWVPLEGLVIKFNVDGSVMGQPGISGIRGVLRDAKGKILGCISRGTRTWWAYKTDGLAILHVLLSCQHYNVENVNIESDSTLAIGLVSKQGQRP